ncbi:hypothetical protein [Cryptosporangium phraense]|uniref:DUF2154 domain-containing protein n=1 Tax=Cryptosporangium phraense TaxID=2593070 RepID=A0A545APA9_9ACTN|nr:hypothetical protein [Cryptosporangium phraense]TQS43130.1 hypothetical protein FL583_19965 [Cryptosporangium phraense]
MRRGVLGLLVLLLAAACAPADGTFQHLQAVSVSLEDRTSATLDVRLSAENVRVKVADLDDLLLRAVVKRGDGSPSATVVGDDVTVAGSGTNFELTLSSRVRWTLTLSGGASAVDADLRGSRLTSLNVPAGVSRASLWLPAPAGDTSATLSGVGTANVYVPNGVPTRLTCRSGGGTVTVDGVESSGVQAGRLWTPAGWDGARNRYDLSVGGFGKLTLGRS